MENYQEVYLKDACSRLSSGKNIPASRISEKNLYPVYGGNGLRGYTDSYNFSGNCAIVGRQGAFCGNVRYFSGKAYMTEHAVVVTANENNSTHYLAYLLSIMNLGRLSGQSAQPGLSVKTLGNQTILLPSHKYQEKVVKILCDLDKKIAINNAINQNLEKQMQAIFTDWYNTASNGADTVTLESVCQKVTDGSHFSPQNDPSSTIPMLSVKDMRKYDFDLTSCKHISEDDYQIMVSNDCVPQIDDILVAKDGSYLKEIFICNEQKKQAVLSSIAIFRPNRAVIYPEILLAFLKSPKVLQEVRDNYVSGSALPRIVLKDFKKLNLNLPSLKQQEAIIDILKYFRYLIAANIAENLKLINLRDILLPMLMSGELDVSSINI